ncbi:hypothetical protein ACSFA0_23655 [Variovorax sp. LT1P1]|uniref:hypothetical protein n=1 Tax=Variovorax sp. LT1P1 TaxID=3443730 RepID=UPI003F48B293
MTHSARSRFDFRSYFDGLEPGTPYTGVGSRDAPRLICELMCAWAILARERGLILRSGGADGSDLAFESGGHPSTEIWLPFRGFNGNPSPLVEPPPGSTAIASSVHPAWNQCNDFSRKAHSRNVPQVLGRDLRSPSAFMVCWTPRGARVGGTRTAIVLAEQHHIPVVNLGDSDQLRTLQAMIPPELLHVSAAFVRTQGTRGGFMPPLKTLEASTTNLARYIEPSEDAEQRDLFALGPSGRGRSLRP